MLLTIINNYPAILIIILSISFSNFKLLTELLAEALTERPTERLTKPLSLSSSHMPSDHRSIVLEPLSTLAHFKSAGRTAFFSCVISPKTTALFARTITSTTIAQLYPDSLRCAHIATMLARSSLHDHYLRCCHRKPSTFAAPNRLPAKTLHHPLRSTIALDLPKII